MSKPIITAKTYLRIGQIAERSGVSAKALRLYEQRGLLKPCAHSESGYRLYGPDALRRLMQIVVLKRSGFSLAELGRLLARDVAAAANLLATRIGRPSCKPLIRAGTALPQAMASHIDRMVCGSGLRPRTALDSHPANR